MPSVVDRAIALSVDEVLFSAGGVVRRLSSLSIWYSGSSSSSRCPGLALSEGFFDVCLSPGDAASSWATDITE